ncbi:hypothetical protein Back2_19330 [Nocardioides baekrokdamisoli]|uniref:Chorismate-utilising enzyme C-terminal domain-containing protein n=1 Tax=Nocardioides baekrokdamisoli TaxID=1804624 RepID=A0A3G9IH58_9ACTN|nr:anthranilate synthase component I family protein [Nocardioides baekrokdamisoli]BBH17646.1 hypothetical protein Back2_19330 [Nocardioides baekrokdamisoli]
MTRHFAQVAALKSRCFWLDGGGAQEWAGTTSLIGWLEDSDPSLTYSAARREVTLHRDGRAEVIGTDIFDALAAFMGEGGQWFGYFGYACRTDLPARPSADVPDAVWMRPSYVRRSEAGELLVPGSSERSDGAAAAFRTFGRSGEVPTEYAQAFRQVQDQLLAGNSYETNLTYRMTRHSTDDPAEIYLRLRGLNPAPYGGYFQHDVPGASAWLLSSSPERYALITAPDRTGDRWIETRPIKGTAPRGATPEEDADLAHWLQTDPKTRAENLMVLDLLRNDVGMVAEPGTVSVPDLMKVESYASVHQLVSTVRGRLRDGVDTMAALRALFPAGSMTGAPKVRTMEIIDAVETTARGAYSGAFGWISSDGRADLGVIIRTLTSADARTWSLGVGGGITVRSTVDEEYAEAELKAVRLLAALGESWPEVRAPGAL